MNSKNTSDAFSLVEVTLALGVAGFCLLALFGLLPVGISSNQASVTQSGAANIATGIIADIEIAPKTNPPTAQLSPQFKINVPISGGEAHTLFFKADGTAIGTIDTAAKPSDDPFYRALLKFNSDVSPSKATSVRIVVTWPALGDRNPNSDPVNFSGSFETVVGLNRN